MHAPEESRMKKIALALSLVLTLGASAALAADGKALYAKCLGCHGVDGSKTAQSKSLKGQKADALQASLAGYKAKKFGGAKKAVMEGQTAAMSDADMKALADYISKL
jgi:cytochrome c